MKVFWKVLLLTLMLQLVAFIISYFSGISFKYILSLYLFGFVWLELERNSHE
jgi:hypothetical protein